MTLQEWEKKAAYLKGRVTYFKNKAKGNVTLTLKINLLSHAKEYEEELNQHKLNYYELVK